MIQTTLSISPSNYQLDILNMIGLERSFHEIQEIVCRHYGLPVSELQNPRRIGAVVEPRQIIMALAYKQLIIQQAYLGFALGRRDHTTVYHAVKVVTNLYRTSRPFREKIKPILTKLGINTDEEFYSLMARSRWDNN